MDKKVILILEGQDTEDYSDLDLNLPQDLYEIKIMKDLYTYPEQILTLDLINPDYLLIQTTGVYHENLKELIQLFEKSEYAPKNIIFGSRMSFDLLVGLAYECIENFGTRIWESADDELVEYEWMYEIADRRPKPNEV